jgi:hypothetical protein
VIEAGRENRQMVFARAVGCAFLTGICAVAGRGDSGVAFTRTPGRIHRHTRDTTNTVEVLSFTLCRVAELENQR